MRRAVTSAILAGGLGLLVFGPSSLAQTAAIDKITYRDRTDGKILTFEGDLKEAPSGVSLLVNGKIKTVVSPADVLRVDPGQLAGITRAELLVALAAEDPREPAKAREAFAALVSKAGAGAPERTRRYLTFREAYWTVKVADLKSDDSFQIEGKKAADKMAAVVLSSRKSWEVWPASRTLARIQLELGDYTKYAATLASLATTPDLTPELRIEAKLAEAGAWIRSKQPTENLLDQIPKEKDFPSTGPLTERLAILREVAKLPAPAGPAKAPEHLAKLVAAVDAAKDPTAKAVGYNFLGDAYQARGLTRDAMWSYLWADVVFTADTDERVYAVHRLIEVFEKLADKDRANQFRERLPQIR